MLQQPSAADNGFTSAVEDDYAPDDDNDDISTEDTPHLEFNSTVTMELTINQHKPDATESLSILQQAYPQHANFIWEHMACGQPLPTIKMLVVALSKVFTLIDK
jgi:hypothetical protein